MFKQLVGKVDDGHFYYITSKPLSGKTIKENRIANKHKHKG